jgi:hypothetical protein
MAIVIAPNLLPPGDATPTTSPAEAMKASAPMFARMCGHRARAAAAQVRICRAEGRLAYFAASLCVGARRCFGPPGTGRGGFSLCSCVRACVSQQMEALKKGTEFVELAILARRDQLAKLPRAQ